jgi:DNA-cytosine methyltransferase
MIFENVLSCFDGMSCGRLALQRAGHVVKKYFASEVDEYAMQIAQKNFPDTIQVGDITKVRLTGKHHFDLIIGGSPCQGFSQVGQGLNFTDPRSKLFFEFVRLLDEARRFNPNVKFLLENVVMKKEWQNVISKFMGVGPIMINSALVSAQNRKRLYWTNIEGITQPEDRGIFLKDILVNDDRGVIKDRGSKAMCIDANYHKGADNHRQRTMLIRIGEIGDGRQGERIYSIEGKAAALSAQAGGPAGPGATLILSPEQIERAKLNYGSKEWPTGNKTGAIQFPDSIDKKSKTLTASATVGGRNTTHILAGRQVGRKLDENGVRGDYNPDLERIQRIEINADPEDYIIRRLTPIECERLQGLPDNYTQGVSNTQRYKMIGNGWQVDTIEHIFKHL